MPTISRFMIFFGTPITFILMMNYLPLVNPKIPQFVFYSCFIECISTGIYVGCLIGLLCSRLFKFDLGASWSDISLIRMFSSGPILFMHPVSLYFINWMSLPTLTMTAAWLIAVIDWKSNWKFVAATEPHDHSEPQDLV